MYFMFLIVLSQLAFLHLGVRDEHLPEVLEEAWPAEHTVGHGGAGHLRDAAHTQELVLRVASQTAHQLTWGGVYFIYLTFIFRDKTSRTVSKESPAHKTHSSHSIYALALIFCP